jgi:hypothetical protein
MSTIGSLGAYAAQLWHTRANPNNDDTFKAQIEEQTASVAAAAAAKAAESSAPVDSSHYDDEAFAKLKLALSNVASAGDDAQSSDGAVSGKTEKTASEQFHDWMNMTPGEKLRASILKELGITEEDLANMDPEARKSIEDGIAEKVQTLFAKQAEENQRNYRSDHGASEQELINLTA